VFKVKKDEAGVGHTPRVPIRGRMKADSY
jgi:hypothetical protein